MVKNDEQRLDRSDRQTRPAPGMAPAGARLYCIGDIHGRDDLLARAFRRIKRDSEDAPELGATRKVIVLLGDYVDRGPASLDVVDMILDQTPEGFDLYALMGNHEDFLLKFLDEPSVGLNWILNGGGETLRSYGLDEKSYESHIELAKDFAECLPERHLSFYRTLLHSHAEGGYLFVHAGLKPGLAMAKQTPFDMMWTREPFLSSQADHGKVVVHGHTISMDPVVRHNRIGLDTGAYQSGKLTVMGLQDDRLWFV